MMDENADNDHVCLLLDVVELFLEKLQVKYMKWVIHLKSVKTNMPIW